MLGCIVKSSGQTGHILGYWLSLDTHRSENFWNKLRNLFGMFGVHRVHRGMGLLGFFGDVRHTGVLNS